MTGNKDFPNFLGKIERGVESDLKDAVSVTEKMDGSYFQFGWYKGDFRYRTKNTLDIEGINDKMFQKVIKELEEHKELFPKDVVFCCEYFRSQRHNSISYDFSLYDELTFNDPTTITKSDRVIENDECFLFIIDDYRPGSYSPGRFYGDGLYYLSRKVGKCYIDILPQIPINDIGDINSAVMGKRGAIREGIVIKKKDGTRLKFVSDHFKEVACKKKRPKMQSQKIESIWEPYIDGLRARVDKAIFRLKEQGVELCKESFGKTIGETVKDLLIEEKANIANDLFKFYEVGFKKKVNRAIIDILLEKHRESENDTCNS